MNRPPLQTEPQTEAQQRAQDAQYYRGILQGLIEMGNDIAGMIHKQAQRQAEAAAPDTPPHLVPSPETRRAFDEMARTIRRCIMLGQKVCAPVKVPAADETWRRRNAARRQITRRVDDSIHRDAPADGAEALRAEFAERLDAPEFEDDLDRPVDEVIHEIRADLGLMGADGLRRWKRRTPQDVAQLNARAAAAARASVGPFNLPMPPKGWVDPGPDNDGAPRCRSGP